MTDWREILVHVNDSPRTTAQVRLAAALAASVGARLHALYAVDAMSPGAYLSPEAAALAAQLHRDSRQDHLAQARERVAAAGADLTLALAEGDPLSDLLAHARCSDLLMLGQHDPQHPDGVDARLASRLIMGAGCPLLFLPFAGDFDLGAAHGGPRVLVAWSPTRESARALRDALPILRRASAVEVVRFVHAGEPATSELDAVLRHLERHGVAATGALRTSREPTLAERVLPGSSPDAPVAEALLSHAADLRADLLVMGGFGHSRAWELVLGGVTRTLLQSMTLPVLMSH